MPTSRRIPLIDPLERRQLFAAVLGAVGSQPAGPLTGKIVYTSGGHGFTASASGVWATQRGLTNGIVEDMGNQDQLTYFADAAFRAGATVVPMRPLGHQLNEAVVDNVNATYTGAWSASTTTTLPYYSTTNGTGAKYMYAATSTTETAVATFTPTLAAAGFYPVYAWAAQGSDRAADQTYRVNHDGGATEVKVNHGLVGNGWVYLGTYYFTQGTAGNVQVSNKSATTGKVVIADAIRFGNGMGDVTRNGLTSGRSREDEASLYWIEAERGWLSPGTRVATSIFGGSLTADVDRNVAAPSKWAAYMNSAPFGQSVYVGFHSNASGGTGEQAARGTEGLYNDSTLFPGTQTKNQKALATLLGNEVTKDLVAYGSPPLEYPWVNNANPIYARTDYAFGEIRGDSTGNEFDATIVEVAFHDNPQDAALLLDPDVREKVAESSTVALEKYFNAYGGGVAATFAPAAPTDLRTTVDAAGNLTLRWDAPATTAVYGGAPTGYRIYASRDGYGFDGGRYVAGGSTLAATVAAASLGAGAAFFKVVAINAGGESLPTTVAAVKRGIAAQGRVLIVNAFDRLDRNQDVVESLPINGTNSASAGVPVAGIVRVRPRAGNSFDYAVQHAMAIGDAFDGVGFDTVDDEAIDNGKVNFGSYDAVIWSAGEESTEDHTFDAIQQRVIASYVANGGRLLTTGSEIGYDLVAKNNGAAFFGSTLRAGYVSDDANTHAAVGVAGSIFGGISLQFGFDDTSYNVDYPDVLKVNGSSAVLTYSGGTGGVAATAYAAGNGGRVTTWGFPFETVTAAATRTQLMKATLTFFGIGPSRTPKTSPAASRNARVQPGATGSTETAGTIAGRDPVAIKPPVAAASAATFAIDEKAKASRAAVLLGLI